VFTCNDTLGWCINAVAFVCMIAAGTHLPLLSIIFGHFVTILTDYIVGNDTAEVFRDKVNEYTLWFIWLFIARFGFSYVWIFLISANAIRITRALRLSLLSHTLRQEIAFFESSEARTVSAYVTMTATSSTLVCRRSWDFCLRPFQVSCHGASSCFRDTMKANSQLSGGGAHHRYRHSPCAWLSTRSKRRRSWPSTLGRIGLRRKPSRVYEPCTPFGHPKLARQYEDILDDDAVVGKRKSPNYAVLFSIEFCSIFAGMG